MQLLKLRYKDKRFLLCTRKVYYAFFGALLMLSFESLNHSGQCIEMVPSRHLPVILVLQQLQHCLQVQHFPEETRERLKLFSTKIVYLIIMEGVS